MSSIEIVLRNDGTAFRRTTSERDLGDISPTLIRLIEHAPFCVPYVTSNWHIIRRPTEQTTILFREVPVIRMKASFKVRVVDDEVLVSPDYRMDPSNTDSDRIEGMFEWRPHRTQQVLLAVEHSSNFERTTYLFFRHRTTHRVYRPPMGNVYSDGRLCLGDFERESCGIIETSQAILNWIMASRWNSDIITYSTAQLHAMFTWDANRNQVPVPENWDGLCDPFSTDCPNIVADMLTTGVVG